MNTPVKPRHKRRTSWSALLAIAAGLPQLLNQVAPVLPPKWAQTATAVGVIAAAVAALFSREAADQAQRAAAAAATFAAPEVPE